MATNDYNHLKIENSWYSNGYQLTRTYIKALVFSYLDYDFFFTIYVLEDNIYKSFL